VSDVRTTVILPAYRAWDTLPAALEALRPQVNRPDRELVLVESSGDVSEQELKERWPWARVIAPGERTLPGRARNLAVREARGEVLAFTDADAVVEPAWLDELEGALTDGIDGVAGVVLNGAPSSMVGTADYLLEFSDWLPRPRLPMLHGATCNLLLRRAVLDSSGFPEDVWPGEDTIVTFRLGAGGRLAFAPRARIRHQGRTRFRDFVTHQSQLGASFACVCAVVEFPYRGLARRRYAPLLPALRLFAVARRVRGNPAAIRAALRVSPLIAIGAVAWSTGLVRARLKAG
jgi:cellulose synthase/poly-beta-1,6-N-acetylglucosamine synthase-like glycosyltransferase